LSDAEEGGEEAEEELEAERWLDDNARYGSDAGSAILTGGAEPSDIPQKELAEAMPSSPVFAVDISDFPDIWAESRTFTFV
jgi:hypothetical protein